MKRIFVLLVGLSLIFQSSATADEGMWLPSLIHKLNIGEMQEMGMELSADEIYSINNSSLKDAIVALDHAPESLYRPKGCCLPTTIAVSMKFKPTARLKMIIYRMVFGRKQRKRNCQILAKRFLFWFALKM